MREKGKERRKRGTEHGVAESKMEIYSISFTFTFTLTVAIDVFIITAFRFICDPHSYRNTTL